MAVTLPLFPLNNVVLFPNVILPLHIHEPRYIRMTQSCLAGDQRFGVALLRDGLEVGGLAVPYMSGTVAHIREHRALDDGRYVLLTLGELRFHISAVRPFDERLEADIEYFEDEPASAEGVGPLQQQVIEAARAHAKMVREAVGAEPDEPVFPSDPRHLGFFLASNLPFAAEGRQALLELTDTTERLRRVLKVLISETETLGRRLALREEAEHILEGNGKLKHVDHLDPDVLGSLEN